MTEQNRERLKIVIWVVLGMFGTLIFWPVGLVANISLIAWLLFKIFH